MGLRKWSNSEVEYGRKVMGSGLDGFRSGGEAFLDGKPLTPFLGESARKAITPAVLGASLGALASLPGNEHGSIGRMLMFGLLGGAIGFGAGLVWESRGLSESAASEAFRNIHRVRDEHWVEKHPVAYA